MRKLYFDIDGTLLMGMTSEPKPKLANGAFERAVRQIGVERLVCVGNFVDTVRVASTVNPEYEPINAIFSICRGVFFDEEWFRDHIALVQNPDNRAGEVDVTGDWWYVDDLAEYYFEQAGREDVFRSHSGGRIFTPRPEGDGSGVLAWLANIPQP